MPSGYLTPSTLGKQVRLLTLPTERVEMPALQRLALPVAIVVSVLLLPRPAGTETEPCSISVTIPEQPAPVVHVTIPEAGAPIVNLTIPESQPIVNLTLPEQPAPVVHVDVEGQQPEIVYRDRDVERIVEVPACIDFADLPYFDLANALTVAFPGEPWSLSGSHYNGLVWHGETPMPDMTAIIAGWLEHLEADCNSE